MTKKVFLVSPLSIFHSIQEPFDTQVALSDLNHDMSTNWVNSVGTPFCTIRMDITKKKDYSRRNGDPNGLNAISCPK